MTARLSPAMESLLRSAADHPDGRAYNNGARGFLRTHDALVGRGLLAEVDSGAGVITDAGRAAIGRALTAAELAERARVAEAAELAAAERARVAEVARRHGWQPAAGDKVTLPDGTGAEVLGGRSDRYPCRECDGSHPFPDLRTEQAGIMGAPVCALAPTVGTARAYLLGRAAHLDREVAADPGYPANPRWIAETDALRAAAAELDPAGPRSIGAYADLCLTCGRRGCTAHAEVDHGEPGESAHTVPGDAERTAMAEEDAAELAGVRADEAAELAAEAAEGTRSWAELDAAERADTYAIARGRTAAELAGPALRLPAGVRLTTAAELAAELDAGRAAMAERLRHVEPGAILRAVDPAATVAWHGPAEREPFDPDRPGLLAAGRPYGDQDVIEQAAAMRERTGRPVTLGEARDALDALDAARTEGREQGS